MRIGGDEIYSSLADIFASAGRKPSALSRARFFISAGFDIIISLGTKGTERVIKSNAVTPRFAAARRRIFVGKQDEPHVLYKSAWMRKARFKFRRKRRVLIKNGEVIFQSVMQKTRVYHADKRQAIFLIR